MPRSHDQNFKNLILDYPRAALEFLAPAEAPAPDEEVQFVPVRQEQLKARLRMGFRELDTPLLAKWADGRREAVVFVLEEESDWHRFSLTRLAHYCLDIAELLDTSRVVPVVVFLRDAGRAPSSMVLGTERDAYLTFKCIACELAAERVERWWDSGNIVARVNLPNMRGAEGRPVATYGQAVRGLLELEADPNLREKYLEFIDMYAELTDNQLDRYRQEHPEESSIVAGAIARARESGRDEVRREMVGVISKARDEGRAEGERVVLERLLRRRFGIAAQGISDRLRRASEGELAVWAENVLDARTLDDVFDPVR